MPARSRIQPAANQALWQTAAHEGGHSTRLSATTRTRQCMMQHQPRNYSYQTHRSQLQGWNLVLLALWQSCRFHEDECTMCGGQSRAPLESSASDGRCQRPVACVLTCFSTRASLSISQRASFLTSHQIAPILARRLAPLPREFNKRERLSLCSALLLAQQNTFSSKK